VLPPDQYVASLARKRMAATAFFRDDQGRVLLVNPVYKETWDLPGGAVEAEESPHAACRREVAEELGWTGRRGVCSRLTGFLRGRSVRRG
jgi:8-oxo-dGTP pyrophosphatase MutT (NUDIX family)